MKELNVCAYNAGIECKPVSGTRLSRNNGWRRFFKQKAKKGEIKSLCPV